MVAIVDQGRALAGKAPLDSATGLLPALYAAPAAAYHDITVGGNGFAAGPGYDLATGIGTPVADSLVSSLVGYNATTPVIHMKRHKLKGVFIQTAAPPVV
jgi:hypothetical protein